VIPVYINTFNRLTTTRQLVEQIANLDEACPIVIDNNSDFGPLLDWYDSCPCEVIRLRDNLGHHAPWLSGVVGQDAAPLYVVTDCDLDLSGVPADTLQILREPLHWSRPAIKSGLGLRIDDLPPWQSDVAAWEARWWKRPVGHDPRFFWAAIDTTFAMYRGETPHELAMQVVRVPAVRAAAPYVARHVPWYLDGSNLDAENAHYFATANASNSWKLAGRKLCAAYAASEQGQS